MWLRYSHLSTSLFRPEIFHSMIFTCGIGPWSFCFFCWRREVVAVLLCFLLEELGSKFSSGRLLLLDALAELAVGETKFTVERKVDGKISVQHLLR